MNMHSSNLKFFSMNKNFCTYTFIHISTTQKNYNHVQLSLYEMLGSIFFGRVKRYNVAVRATITIVFSEYSKYIKSPKKFTSLLSFELILF